MFKKFKNKSKNNDVTPQEQPYAQYVSQPVQYPHQPYQGYGQPVQYPHQPYQGYGPQQQYQYQQPIQPIAPKRDAMEEALQMLADYDVVFIVDDSGSMANSRWSEALEAVSIVVPLASKYDDDGVDVHFINNPQSYNIQRNHNVMSKLQNIKPGGRTPLGAKMQQILSKYCRELPPRYLGKNKRHKPLDLIIITDGAPTDGPLVESSIVNAAREMEKRGYPQEQIGIQFFQVGNDVDAKNYLEYLDDNLEEKYRIRDIVDTTPFNPNDNTPLKYTIRKALLGGIDADIDNNMLRPKNY